LGGFFPVVHSITPFITERCFEQIKDDLCYQNTGVNIVSVGSAFDYAALGCTHHSYDDIGILRTLPRMQIVYPAAPHEFDILFKEAYANGAPTYFRLPEHIHSLSTHPKFGEVEQMREGNVVTVIAAGPQLQNAWEAAEEAARAGVLCDLWYVTTIKPLSAASEKAIAASVAKTGKVVTVEEHSVIGGIGDLIALICGGERFTHVRLGVNDKFLECYGTYEEHCKANGLTKENILKAIHDSAGRNR